MERLSVECNAWPRSGRRTISFRTGLLDPVGVNAPGEFRHQPDRCAAWKKPALVRVFEGTSTRAAAVASNEGGTLRMSALEQAKVDGERLGRVDLASADDGGWTFPRTAAPSVVGGAIPRCRARCSPGCPWISFPEG